MNRYLGIFLFIFPLLASYGPCLAQEKVKVKEKVKDNDYLFNNVTVSFGSWKEFVGDIQITKGGTKNTFLHSQYTPYFSVAVDYPLKDLWSLMPELGYVIQRQAGDSKITKNLFFIRSDVAYLMKKWLKLRFGTSLMILNITGIGGEKTLPNAGSSEVYFLPSQRRTALNQTLDFAVETIYDRMSLKFASYIYAWNEDTDRMTSFSISLNYLIPLKEM